MKLRKLFCTLDLSLPRDAMQARPSRPAVSVCLSVCPSRSWILSKRINILQTFFQTGSHNILVVPYIWLHCVLNTATARCYQHGAARPWKVVTFIAASKGRSLLMAGDDVEVFMTRSLNVTPKKTEQNLIIRCDKSVAYVKGCL